MDENCLLEQGWKKCCPVIQVEFPVGQVTFHFHLGGKGAGKLSANLIVFKDLPRGRKI